MNGDGQRPRPGGRTASEQLLLGHCDRTFLRMWSYVNPFTDRGRTAQNPQGKELCDLLVVCGRDAIVFSDKSCTYPSTGKPQLDWSRWVSRAILDSAKQLYGAERWIRQYPDRIYLDPECSERFPLGLPREPDLRVHRIVVALGAGERCREHFGGGSGSLMIHPEIHGKAHLAREGEPCLLFTVGQPDPTRGIVHVFDDVTLDIVLRELDTIKDFVEYLVAKEQLLKSGLHLMVAGEEELLAVYLQNRLRDGLEKFMVTPDLNGIAFEEGHWQDLVENAQFRMRKIADQISYVWDHVIDDFATHIIEGKTVTPLQGTVADHEEGLRVLAMEPRFQRRVLSIAFSDLLERAPRDRIGNRLIPSQTSKGVLYVFNCVPLNYWPLNLYRERRQDFLRGYCLAAAEKYREYSFVVGIGTETGIGVPLRSHDLCVTHVSDWTEELVRMARSIRTGMGLLDESKIVRHRFRTSEYPEVSQNHPSRSTGPRPNEPCPCGSGVRAKHCCFRRRR
jgi:hypothetical protein